MFKLREYQELAHEQITEAFKRSVKLLMVMSTGAGKSKTAVSYMKKHLKHFNWILVVRKRDLVNQLSNDLDLFEIDYGVYMAGDKRYSPSKSVQLCSIDTLDSRGSLPFINDPKDIILIIDEADESLSEQYKNLIHRYVNRTNFARPVSFSTEDLLKPMRPAFLLGMTATPYDKALTHFTEYIQPVSPKELRDKYKALVDFKYIIPDRLDFANIKIVKGEFNAKDIERERNTPERIAEDFSYWLSFGDDRQTLVFTSSQSHAKNVAAYINSYYGKELAISVDANSSSEERQEVYTKFRNGIIRFIINVRLVTRGVDIDIIGTILDLAPTLSINLHIQKIGRGSRQNPIYKDCIIIDPVSNLINNGVFYPTEPRLISLTEDRKRSRKDLSESMIRICSKCIRADEPAAFGPRNICPFCGHHNARVEKKKLSAAAHKKLIMAEASPEKIEQIGMINEFKKILWQCKNLKQRDGKILNNDEAREAAHNKMIKKHGIKKVEKIKQSIGLSEHVIKRHKEIYDYVPLGGTKP